MIVKIEEFKKMMVQDFFKFLNELKAAELFEDIKSSYKSKRAYNGFWYEIIVDNSSMTISFVKSNIEEKIEILSVPFLPPEFIEKLDPIKRARMLEAAASRVYLSDLSLFEMMKNDLNVDFLKKACLVLNSNLKKYYSNMVNDLNVIFDLSKHFKKSIVLRYEDYHKYTINGKEIVVCSQLSCIDEYFTIYERDKRTHTIRIITDTVENVFKNHKYKTKTIVIGKHRKIVEDYLNTYPSVCVVESDNVKHVDKIEIIERLNSNARDLSKHFNIEMKRPYDPQDMKEMLKYLTFDNMYTLLTHGLWSIKGRWQINSNDEYFFVFESEIENVKDHEEMSYEKNGLEYVSLTSNDSAMLSLPKGKLKEEWKELIVKSFNYIKENKAELSVCQISDQEFLWVETYLKDNKYID